MNKNRFVLLCSILVCLILAGAMLIPVTAASQTQTQAYFVPDTQRGDTAVIQVAYEPPPAALQVTDEPAPTEASPEPTAIVITAVPTDTPDGNEQPGSTTDSTIKLIAVFVVTNFVTFLATLVGALTVFSRMKTDKNALDTVERVIGFMATLSPSTPLLTTVNQLGHGLQDAGEVLEKVSDGQPNDINPPTLPNRNQIYRPGENPRQ